MNGKERARDNHFSINSLLKIACILLFLIFVVCFVKTRLDVTRMQQEIVEMDQKVEQKEKEYRDMLYNLLPKEGSEDKQEETEAEGQVDQSEQSEVQDEGNGSDSQQYEDAMERAAREKLGYAYPDERVFVDISGAN